jgi:hypothetical protein
MNGGESFGRYALSLGAVLQVVLESLGESLGLPLTRAWEQRHFYRDGV